MSTFRQTQWWYFIMFKDTLQVAYVFGLQQVALNKKSKFSFVYRRPNNMFLKFSWIRDNLCFSVSHTFQKNMRVYHARLITLFKLR